MSTRFTYISNRVIDTDGISDGASVAFYLPGTTDLVNLYSDSAATVPVSNPYFVPAGAAIPPLYYTEDSVRVRITTSSGDVAYDEDPWVPIASAGEAIASTEFIYVSDYFEEGDEDDTDAFYRCIQAAAASGRGVSFRKGEGSVEVNGSFPRWEAGDYKIGINGANNIPDSAGNLVSNVIVHIPAGVAIRQKPNTSYMFYHNPIGVGTVVGSPHITNVDDAATLKNVRFEIDGTLDGNCDSTAQGFSENVTLLYLAGAKNIEVRGNGAMINTRSDFIQVGPGDVGGFSTTVGEARQVHHCANVTIRGLTFDGIDKNTRNAIAILDCDGLLIEDCVFKNCSRPGGGGNPTDPFDINTGSEAPGFIDYEPNYFSFPWIVLRNCHVRNCSFDAGGTGGVVYNLPHNKYQDGATTHTNLVTMEGFTVRDCQFKSVPRPLVFQTGGHPDANDIGGPGYKVAFENNVCRDSARSFDIMYGRGLAVRNNLFVNSTAAGYFGYLNLYGLRDIILEGNRFELCGNALGAFQMIGYGGEHITIDKNEFLDCAVAAFAVSGAGTGGWKDTKIRWNRILPATAGAAKSMGSAIYNSDHNGTVVLENHSITEEGNDWGSLRHFSFVVNGSRSTSIPAGDWVRGSTVYFPDAPPGEPEKFVCIYPVSGAADPDAWGEYIRPGGISDIDWTPSGSITKSAGMTESADWRFTSTASGVQYAYTASTLAASPGAEIILRAPRSGWSNVLVGFSDAAAPTTVNDVDYGVSFNGGTINGVVNGALNGPDTSANITYEWMQEFRIRLVSGTVTIWRRDPLTNVETQVYTGSGFINAATRLAVVISGEEQSVQITKFGAP